MSRATRKLVIVPFLAAALLGAGCSSTVAGNPAPAGGAPAPAGGDAGAASTDDPVAWADQVCGAMLDFVTATGQQPDIDPSAQPDEVLQGLSEYLGAASTAAGTTAESVRAAGPAPVDNGEDIANQLVETFTTIETTFEGVQTNIENIDASDPTALSTELPEAFAEFENLSSQLGDPTSDLNSNPELNAAAEQAPNCQQIEQATQPGGN